MNRMPVPGRGLAVLRLLLLMAGFAGCGAVRAVPIPLSLDGFRFQSMRVGGHIAEEIEKRSGDQLGDQLRDRLDLDLRGVFNGYYVQPWLASWQANFAAGFTWNNELFGDLTASSFSNLQGGASLRLFPESKFPVSMALSRIERYADDTLLLADREYATTDLRINGSYLTNPRATYNYSYDHTWYDRTGDGLGDQADSQLDRLRLTGNFTLTPTQMADSSIYLANQDWDGSKRRSRDMVLAARHRYSARPARLDVDSHFDATVSSNSADDGSEETTEVTQLTSTLNWGSALRPLTAFATAYLARIANDFRGSRADQTSDLARLNGRATYIYSPQTTLYADAALFYRMLNQATRDDDEELTLQSGLAADYRAPARMLPMDFSYNWNARSALRSTSTLVGDSGGGDDGDEVELSGEVAQNLSRHLAIRSFAFTVNHQSGVDARENSNRGFESALNLVNTASVSWSGYLPRRTMSASLSLTDDRDIALVSGDRDDARTGARDRATQRIDLFGRLGWQLTARSQLDANLNINANWSEDDNESTSFTSSSFDVTYRHDDLFNVPRMTLVSLLAARNDDYLPWDPGDDEGTYLTFDNTIRYYIGRLQAELEADWLEVDGVDSWRIFFRVKREFGR